ncbi:phenylalanine ammonia-lyase [Myriangium duriaei CBS 260.36]|uniref:Phenylalanine ammonia-lyase n=1 Tax=Myriangium duriaei CBS 260.36 TaxID=1168546 RepID=A0A9P4IR95_9PEZI|nr:phenylalanine ammonia-lyase [Myriangium duriaei CBS 260.36]
MESIHRPNSDDSFQLKLEDDTNSIPDHPAAGQRTRYIQNGCTARKKPLEYTAESRQIVVLNGENLSLRSLVAVARIGIPVRIDDGLQLVDKIHASVDLLQRKLDAGHSIYGVTTGFGGSADTTTDQFEDLQTALLQMQLCGVVPERSSLDYEADLATMSMPETWVRAAIVVRLNSLVRGHSAVRLCVLKTLEEILQKNVIPLVPLHGSISASGDLSPLSYIASAISGNPDVQCWTDLKDDRRSLVPSHKALERKNIKPVRLGAKEGLGILNGTAFSAAVAGLALFEANQLASLSQILTAMAVEALNGSTESFDPFIGAVRPHRGQSEVAKNIRKALRGSSLVQEAADKDKRSLRQDRYALRTASQWLGPSLEDLSLAKQQLETELNSTTDNPIFDTQSEHAFHGGNFQATSVTSSTEKTRHALQMIGKLLFAQSSELLDSKMNHGLPPNLAFDEPSLSFTLKGVDISMAAYMAELGFLANTVSSHVQSAEMGNQSVNSMALVSARYTHKAVDIVSLMVSAHLYSLCQALDLRALNEIYLAALRPKFNEITTKYLTGTTNVPDIKGWRDLLWSTFDKKLETTVSQDSSTRFLDTSKALQPILLDNLVACSQIFESKKGNRTPTANMIQDYTNSIADAAREVYIDMRKAYGREPDATPFLGAAAERMYTFVRKGLSIPLHKGLVDHPWEIDQDKTSDNKKLNIGSWISKIHAAVRDGRVAQVAEDCL